MKKLWMILAPFILIIFLAQPALAELTISNIEPVSLGNKRGVLCDIAFDSSYAFGGESLTGTSVGMVAIDRVIVEGKDGYVFDYDRTNTKLRALTKAPPIVYEEKHTAGADGTFTLDYPAAFIVAIAQGGTGGGTAFQVAYSGTTTLSAGKACLPDGIDTNVRTAVSCYTASVDYYVTYATQAWHDLYALLVQNEAVHILGGASRVALASGNTMFAFQCAIDKNGATVFTPVDYGYAPGKGEIGIDFGRTGTSTSYLGFNNADRGVSAYVTYLKYPAAGSWLRNQYVRDETATAGTSVMQYDKPLLLPLLSGFHFTKGGTSPWFKVVLQDQPTYHFSTVQQNNQSSGVSEIFTSWGYRGPAPAGSAPTAAQVWSMYDNSASTPAGKDVKYNTYLAGHPWNIPNVVPLEVVNGADLSALTSVKAFIIGY